VSPRPRGLLTDFIGFLLRIIERLRRRPFDDIAGVESDPKNAEPSFVGGDGVTAFGWLHLVAVPTPRSAATAGLEWYPK
jgi:hypothetical protein